MRSIRGIRYKSFISEQREGKISGRKKHVNLKIPTQPNCLTCAVNVRATSMRRLCARLDFTTVICFQLWVRANCRVIGACADDLSLSRWHHSAQRGKHGNGLNGSGLRFTLAIPSLTRRNLGFAVHYWACAHLGSVLIDLSD